MEMPTYLFTGFLDSGKTKFIQETLEDPRFYDGERTLVILFEEGDEEYNPTRYPSENVFFHTFNDVAELSRKSLLELQKKYRMQRVLIEYNGMWLLDELYRNLPENWLVYQEMMFVDSTTFSVYNANMRNLVADKMKSAETVIFNRVPKDSDLISFHKEVRVFSRTASIIYEFTDGEIQYDEFEDPLPFDIDANVIEIKDTDYALWYRDLTEDFKKYCGKTVSFKGIIATDEKMPKGSLAIGRHIMTCCAEDISYGALIMKCDNAHDFKTKDWVQVKGKIVIEKHDVYDFEGPVIYAENVDITLPPKQELATFY